jgi:hypothetical protein
MRPDAETSNAFVYCLAYAGERYAVEVLYRHAASKPHSLKNQPGSGRRFFAECLRRRARA